MYIDHLYMLFFSEKYTYFQSVMVLAVWEIRDTMIAISWCRNSDEASKEFIKSF